MSTKFTTWPSPLCNTLITKVLFILLLGLYGHPLLSQQEDLLCNDRTPWVNGTFSVTESFSSNDFACWEGDLLCTGDDEPSNVTNSNLTDFAEGHMLLLGSMSLRVSDLANVYEAGNVAGFIIESDLISTGLFSSIRLITYLNGVPKDTFISGDLLTLSTSLLSGPFPLGFVTTEDYNEIQIDFNDLLGVGAYRVYYAFMEKFCEGPALDVCNTQVAMNRPVYPVRIDYENTGSDAVSVGTVDDPEDAISASTTDFASLINLASVAGSTFLTVEEMVTDYPAGTYVGFDIENLTLLGAGVLNYITITSYLDGEEQEEVSGPDLLAGVPLLGSTGRHTVGFVTSTEVDKVKITVEQPVGITLGTTRVYSAIFQRLCEGVLEPCNDQTIMTSPSFPVYIDVEHTGLSGLGCVGCNVVEAGNVIDEDSMNYAQIILVNGTAVTGSLSVKDELTDYPAGVFTGFRIENANLVDADALAGITIRTYLDGTEQEIVTDLDALITVGSGLLINEDQQLVGFVTTEPFDEVRITISDVATVDVGTTRIFELVIQNLCPPLVECNQTYFWNTEAFPVYIDEFRTGPDGVACALCTVDDAENVIDTDTSNYATIFVLADILGSASLAVADALYDYPAGTFAGFVIEDPGPLIEVELFDFLTVSTYLDGDFQESRTGGDLIDLALLILFISADEGRYNVGFHATLPFDEIRISVGSLASVPNIVRVYSAFVDTRLSNGGELLCLDGPVAIDDNAVTDEDEPVDIDVLENDMPGDNPISPPVVIDGPDHGSTTVNPDSTITYTPDSNFTGIDTFAYEICNDQNECDTAIVIIIVNPVNDPPDAVDDQDTTGINTEVIIDVLGNDSDPDSPLGQPVIDDDPLNGTVVVNADSTVTYTPDEDFVGVDSFTYVICDAGVPVYCDTATVTVYVLPERDTIIEELPVDSILEVCVSVLTELGNPVIMTVCDSPSNGIVIIIDTCLTFIPDLGFEGNDTICVIICDALGPCDTTTIIVIIDIPLPVGLMDFEARKSGNSALLTWKTAFEFNSDYFEIQRAGEDQLFSTIAIAESKGTGHSVRSYDYTDGSLHKGLYYYRLRMMDIDGRSSLSPIRPVAFGEESLKISVWPNPVTDELNIETIGGVVEPGKMIVINSDGRVVLEQSYDFSLHKTRMDLSSLGAGVYTLILQSAHNYITDNLVVFR